MATSTFAKKEAAVAGQRIDYAAILPGRTKAIILIGVLISLFLAALNQTLVATALPVIVEDLNGLDLLSWVSTSYLLASTTMVPIYGKLSDLWGRKTILLWGISVFMLGSLLCGIAQTMIQLILYRVVQGIGAAALTSTAFAIPADLFTPVERPRYMGMFGAVFGLASVLGPFLGGVLTDNLSWHWTFFVNVPLGIIALFFIISKMPKLASGLRAPIDWLGTILLIVSVVPLLLGLTLDKTLYPWTSPLILGLFAVAAIDMILFLIVESRVASPIIPLKLFRIRTYSVVAVSSVLNGAAFFSAILFLSLFMVNVVGVSVTTAGTTMIPLSLSLVLGNILSSTLVQRIGRYKIIIVIGFLIMLVGFWLLSQMNVNTTRWDVTWRMIVLGLGIGPAMPLLNLAAQNTVPFEDIGAATASRQFFQQLGQAFGGALFGVVLSTTLTAQIQANFQPIVAQLPAEMRNQFDPSQFRQSATGSQAASGEQVDPGARINQEITSQFDQQRALVTAAIQNNDPQARQALLSNPQTPEPLRALLAAGGLEAQVRAELDQQYQAIETALRSGDPRALAALTSNPQVPQPVQERLSQIPPQALTDPQAIDEMLQEIRTGLDAQLPAIVAQAREQALANALQGLDAAEEQALIQGQQLGGQISGAIKQSFAVSITQIYRYAIWLVVAAIVIITCFLPELPLRKTNRSDMSSAFE